MSRLEQIKQQLYAQRYTIHSWAVRHGYNPNTVDKSLRRTVARGRQPRGFIARDIIKGIEKTIGEPVISEIRKKNHARTNSKTR
jgi:hypothetical protein